MRVANAIGKSGTEVSVAHKRRRAGLTEHDWGTERFRARQWDASGRTGAVGDLNLESSNDGAEVGEGRGRGQPVVGNGRREISGRRLRGETRNYMR